MPGKTTMHAPASPPATRVMLTVKAGLPHGEAVHVVGSVPAFGNDVVENSLELVTTPGMYPTWYTPTPIVVVRGTEVEFRLAVFSGGGFSRWEDGVEKRSFRAEGDTVRLSLTMGDEALNATVQSSPDLGPRASRRRLRTLEELELPAGTSTGPAGTAAQRGPRVDAADAVQAAEGSCSLQEEHFGGSEQDQEDDEDDEDEEGKEAPPPDPAGQAVHSGHRDRAHHRRHHHRRDHSGRGHAIVPEVYGTSSLGQGAAGDPVSDALPPRDVEEEEQERGMRIGTRDGVVLVTHVLPVTMRRRNDGTWRVEWDADALLSRPEDAPHRMRIIFVGCPPVDVAVEDREGATAALAAFKCVPVFLPADLASAHERYCHSTLWPVLHNIIAVHGKLPTRWWNRAEQEAHWQAYTSVNRLFAEVVVQEYSPGDMVWVHDYPLLLLPSFLTRRLNGANIGLFLHTPFPSSEIFRTLSVRNDILRGMLCADHIGFHLYEYARHFLTCCFRLLGHTHDARRGGHLEIAAGGRTVRVTAAHAGVQPDKLAHALATPSLAADAAHLRERHAGRTILASIDRLDVLSGLCLKLRAFERLLRDCPHLRGACVLVQRLVLPIGSQSDAEKEQLEAVHRLVAQINEEYGTPAAPAVELTEHAAVGIQDRMTLWRAADVLVSLSLRDARNMGPLEFVVAQDPARAAKGPATVATPGVDAADTASTGGAGVEAAAGADAVAGEEASAGPKESAPPRRGPGVAVLSEFLGCSRIMSGALRVNPWEFRRVVDSLRRAIEMPATERVARHSKDLHTVESNPAWLWAGRMLLDVKRSRKKDSEVEYLGYGLGLAFRVQGMGKDFAQLPVDGVCSAWRASFRRLILLDYGGTLASEGANKFNRRTTAPLAPHIVAALQQLAEDPRTTVCIISSRERSALETAFQGVHGVHLFAEHGFYYRWAHPARGHAASAGAGATASPMASGGGGGPPLGTVESVSSMQSTATTSTGGDSVERRDSGVEGGATGGVEGGPLQVPGSASVDDSSSRGEPGSGSGSGSGPGVGAGHSPRVRFSRQALGSPRESLPSTPPSMSSGPSTSTSATTGSGRWRSLGEHLDESWKDLALSIMTHYALRTSGAYVDEKESALLWQYQDADPEFGSMQAKELQDHLTGEFRGFPVEVLKGKSAVEIRPRGVNKGTAVHRILAALENRTPERPVDFVLCAGDDDADEFMFRALQQVERRNVPRTMDERTVAAAMRALAPMGGRDPRVFSCTVGQKPSHAGHYVHDVDGVVEVLSILARLTAKAKRNRSTTDLATILSASRAGKFSPWASHHQLRLLGAASAADKQATIAVAAAGAMSAGEAAAALGTSPPSAVGPGGVPEPCGDEGGEAPAGRGLMAYAKLSAGFRRSTSSMDASTASWKRSVSFSTFPSSSAVGEVGPDDQDVSATMDEYFDKFNDEEEDDEEEGGVFV